MLKKPKKEAPAAPPQVEVEPVVSAALLQDRIDSLCDAARSLLHHARRDELEFDLLGVEDAPQQLTDLANDCFEAAQKLYEYGLARNMKVRFSCFSRFSVSMLYRLLKKNAVNLRPTNNVYRLPDLDEGKLRMSEIETDLSNKLAGIVQQVRDKSLECGHEPEDVV